MTKPHTKFTYPTEAFGRIPSFNSIEEEAEFWDTHDLSEFIGVEFQPLEARDEAGVNDRLIVQLAPADREALVQQAEAQGIAPAALVRLWIEERLKREAS